MTLDERIDRFMKVRHTRIVAGTQFAAASSECLELFRDGHFYGCIALCQSAGEALVWYMCECNSFPPAKYFEKNVKKLRRRGFIDGGFVEACDRLWGKRNDYHHLKAGIVTDRRELEELALEKIGALTHMEGTVFAEVDSDTPGALRPKHPKYWPKKGKAQIGVYLRF